MSNSRPKALVGGVLAIALSCFGLSYSIPKLLYELEGPREITEAEILKLDQGTELPKGLVAFDAKSLTDTTITKSAKTTVRKYMLVSFGKRSILAIVPPNHTGNHLIGYIQGLDGLTGLDTEAREKVIKKYPGQTLTPHFFQVTDGFQSGRIEAGIFGVFFLLGVFCLLSAFWSKNSSAQETVETRHLQNAFHRR
jgi:hypothetical protein